MTEEKWRRIEGAFGYEVSSLGRVRSWRLRRSPWRLAGVPRILKGSVTKKGYRRYGLSVGAETYGRLGHVLVAEAFLGPRPEGQQVRHLNGDKLDNRAGNLAWGTSQENAEDSTRLGSRALGADTKCAVLTPDLVRWIRKAKGKGWTHRAIAAHIGVSSGTVSAVLSGKTWAHVADEEGVA